MQKALNLFNAALVTPTYYVYFTSTTIISSAILFRGFKGTPASIITVVNGFLTICSGVILLQLSKSAKDVPDTAVFTGDLDQIHTIAEQAQPETEPKADAIRGTAAIVRRLSSARQKMELEELRRLREEKLQESLEPVNEDGVPQYEWDGIRRRRTRTPGSRKSATMASPTPTHLAPPTPHPPLGWSRFPTEEELAEADRPVSPALSNFIGTIRGKARSILLPGHSDFRAGPDIPKAQSPLHPVHLASVAVPGSKPPDSRGYDPEQAMYSPPGTVIYDRDGAGRITSYRRQRHSGQNSRKASDSSDLGIAISPPTPPPHSARRQFSFQNMFRRQQVPEHDSDESGDSEDRFGPRRGISPRGYSDRQRRGATEEEMLGLVKAAVSDTSHGIRAVTHYDDGDDDDDDDDDEYVDEKKQAWYGHSITKGYTHSPPRRRDSERSPPGSSDPHAAYDRRRPRLPERSRSDSSEDDDKPPPPPPHRYGAFI